MGSGTERAGRGKILKIQREKDIGVQTDQEYTEFKEC